MSEQTTKLKSEPKPARARPAAPRRWPLYAAGAGAAVLALAYIDGGEEPIRPIVQEIALPSGAGSSADTTSLNTGGE